MHYFFWLIALVAAFIPANGVAVPQSRDITVGELIPPMSWQKQFRITEGKDLGKLVPLVFLHDPQTKQGWTLVFGHYAAVQLLSDASGALVLKRLDLLKSRSYIVYEPSLAIFAREIAAEAAVRRQAAFKMFDRDTGRLKRVGIARNLVKQVASSQFATPAGAIDGVFVDIEHTMDMPYAHLQLTLRLGFRLDEGPVYASARYTLTKLGLFSETKTAAAALARN